MWRSASASWSAASPGRRRRSSRPSAPSSSTASPPSLKDLAVSLFGTNDKVALVVGIVVVSLALGAVLGRASVRRPWVGVAGFAAFGVVGLLSYLDDPQAEPAAGVVAAVLAVAAGIATLFALLRLGPARRAGRRSRRPASDRRTFLVGAGVARRDRRRRRRRSGAASGRATSSRRPAPRPCCRRPASTAADRRRRLLGDVARLSPYVTPNDDFYRIDTALSVPAGRRRRRGRCASRAWSTARSRSPTTSCVAMADVEDVVTLQCVSNEVGGNLVGNAVVAGRAAGDAARPGRRAGRARRRSSGARSTASRPGSRPRSASTAARRSSPSAMNGEPLPAEHGFPARLVVAGLYGYVSATKWLDARSS